MRKLFAIVAGMLAAFLLFGGSDVLGTALFPAGAVDTSNPAMPAAYIAGLPFFAKLIAAAAWLVAPLGGAWLCLRIADWVPGGWIVTAAFLLAGVFNQIAVPYPLWMQVCAVILPLVGGWLAQRLHRKPYPGEPLLG